MIIKRILFLVIFCIASFSPPLCAWWSAGHELTAQIAKNNLTPKTLKAVNKYIDKLIVYPGSLIASKQTSTIIEASIWCDYIKSYEWENKENSKINSMLHYINPITYPNRKTSRKESAEKIKILLNSNTDSGKYNSYTGLLCSIKTMLNEQSSVRDKAVALRFILHLVGDIHTPMHNAAPIFNKIDTKGGNRIILSPAIKIQVLCSSKKAKTTEVENLHALWDACAGLFFQLPYSRHPKLQSDKQTVYIYKEAQNLADNIRNKKKIDSRINNAEIADWIVESNMIASYFLSTQNIKYYRKTKAGSRKIIAKFRNPKSYIKSAQTVSGQQIYLAGMRLAGLLNAIFDPKHAKQMYVNYLQRIKSNKNIPTLPNLFPEKIKFQ